jgi:hypothetical protein
MLQLKSLNISDSYHPRLQAKLKIGKPGDKYEQEADAVADRVMRDSDQIKMQPIEKEEEMLQPKLRMQPMEEEEEMMQPKIQMQPEEEEEELLQPKIQMQEEEEELLQPKLSRNNSTHSVSNNFEQKLNSGGSSGSSMDAQTQSFMSNRFGTDFSHIRIFNDSTAAQLNRHINARAFTTGNNIYFNKGNYNPNSSSGRHLLAHELTHTIQQGNSVQRMIQKEDEPPSNEESSESSTPLADFVAGLVRDELSDSGMQGHLRSLGTALQGLAENTATEGDQPSTSAERLSALGISRAFESTSAAILRDPAFRQLRQSIISFAGSSEEAALITALAAGLAAYLADIDLQASPSLNLGAGFSTGGSIDMGSAQSIQFNQIQAYVQYANTYFSTRISGSVSRDEETEEFSGSGTGQFRLGSSLSNLVGSVSIDSEGQLTFTGRLSAGYQFGGGSDRLVFTTDVSHALGSGETIIRPGVSGRFDLGRDQALRLGANLQVSTDSGLTGATGFFEYSRSGVQLRLEGNMTGIPDAQSIAPGTGLTFQGNITIPF